MPTNRTRRTRSRGTGADMVTDEVVSYFWWSGTIPNKWARERTDAEIKAFWIKHRKEILTRYIEKNRMQNGVPGRRPHHFWNEITEPRRVVGKLAYFKPGPDGTEYFEDIEEEDYDFLKRLGMLERWEKTAERPKPYD
ncbi:MAG: hypothetical protein WA081_04770 [Desulfosalsimonadaceae bacterium]